MPSTSLRKETVTRSGHAGKLAVSARDRRAVEQRPGSENRKGRVESTRTRKPGTSCSASAHQYSHHARIASGFFLSRALKHL